MASSTGMHQKTKSSNTARLTENKRRYRARRKEYVSDLERRLVEAREQGIRATKEVQLASQQVVRENKRLRELLYVAGFVDGEIEAWVRGGDSGSDESENGKNCSRQMDAGKKEKACAAQGACKNLQACEKTGPECLAGVLNGEVGTGQVEVMMETARISCPPDLGNASTSPDHPDSGVPVDDQAADYRPKDSTDGGKKIPACKLLSHLAENPASDLTQIQAQDNIEDTSKVTVDGEEGVACGKAYELLIRHATSEEKMDDIAKALEGGCTANGKGGCAVKKKVVWQVLDEMCG